MKQKAADLPPHDLDGLYRHIAELVRPLTAPAVPPRSGSRQHAQRSDTTVERWRKHWTPLTSRKYLAGVLSVPGPDGDISAPDTSPEGRAAALREHWAKAFAERPIRMPIVDAMLKGMIGPVPHLVAKPPTTGDIMEAMRRARPSAPGPDMLPYAAWRAAGRPAAYALAKFHRALMKGMRPPRALNAAVGAFIPKGSSEVDGNKRGLHRMAGDTRPLNLKNVDRTLLAATTCYKLRPDLDSWIDSCQLANIIEFDAAARAAALLAATPPPGGGGDEGSAQPCPPAFFFDFAAAFPSVSRRYLRKVLKVMGIPEPLQKFLAALLKRTTVSLCIDGRRFEGWTCHSGVP